MNWIYNNKEFTSDDIGDAIGFVYQITDKQNGMKYIGKKKLWTKRKKPPLKGKKRKRIVTDESDWKNYYGSSEEVKSLVEQYGENRFERKIIRLCYSLGEMSYWETYYQMINHVLLKPNEYYNSFVGCRINRSHVKNVKIES